MNFSQNKILVSHVKKSFDGLQILDDIGIHVMEGEFVSIVGPSGSGKSTLLNIILKLVKEDAGEVMVYGKTSYMYQKDMMVPWKKVVDNVALPLVFQGMKKKEARVKALAYFERFGLEGFQWKYPAQLSGGMKQRANLLKTYLSSNDIMLLDEPFGSLDTLTKRKLQQWLLELRKETKSTMLFITHDVEEAVYLSDRIYIMSEKPAVIKGEVFVEFPFDRNQDIITNTLFNQKKKEVLDLLQGKTG